MLFRFEIARFGLVGIAATLVHAAILSLLIEWFALPVQLANISAFVVAFLVSYLGHHRWTFASDAGHKEAASKFLLTAIIGFVANVMIMELVVVQLGYHYLIGFLCVVFSVPPATYVISRLWIF